MKKKLPEVLGQKRSQPKAPATVIAYFETNDAVARSVAGKLIVEGRNIPIDSRYSARFDRSKVPGMQDHLHIQLRGKDVCVINRDGTPSHGTNPADAPRYVLDYLRNKNWITEAAMRRKFGLPASVITTAVERVRSAGLVARLQKLLHSKKNKGRL